jgi:hypothetical protein
MGNVALLLQLPLATTIQATTQLNYLNATAIALTTLVFLRFAILDRLLYAHRSKRRPPVAAHRR